MLKKGGNIMGITVHYFLPKGAKPTPEQIEEIRSLKNRPITYDEDCMPLSEEVQRKNDYIRQKYNTRRVTKEMWIKEFPEDFKNRNVS